MRHTKSFVLILAGALSSAAAPAAAPTVTADVIYVDDSAINGANDGTSWVNAFIDLHDALAIAKAGDEIRVGQGVYTPAPPNGDRTISFNLVSGTILQGGYAGFGASDPDALDPARFRTVLSGDLNQNDSTVISTFSDNAFHVMTAFDMSSPSSLRGLTIERGRAMMFSNDCFSNPPDDSQGGGLQCANAHLVVEDCVIRRNAASCAGGGMYFQDGTATFTRCLFEANDAASEASSGGGAWGHGSLRFTDCQFIGNTGYSAGGAALRGAVLRRCVFRLNYTYEITAALNASQSALVNCLIDDNYSGTFLGGVYFSDGLIANCTFRQNSAICAGPAGMALRIADNAFVVNSAFIGNRGQTIGVAGQGNSIVNCAIVGNQDCSHGILMEYGSLNLANSIVWANNEHPPATQANQIYIGNGASIAVDRSCIQGWTGSLGGSGNHGSDPRFVDADGPDDIYGTADDDVRLLPNSLCIDSADRALLPPDTFDIDEDGDTTEPLPIDLDGLPRVVGSSLDAGAYEFQGIPCRADIDGNSTVNVNDLLAVILEWGPCVPAAMCNSDLDLNRTVGLSDLLAVINTWGGCP